ncbi:MAG: 1-deoxy-D-xylulose-5-phosphate reductoisomerase [Steroidobacteraceae bacterium]
MIGVAVLGATGSIGRSTLDVLARHPRQYRPVALAARSNAELLAQQCLQFEPGHAALEDPAAALQLQQQLRQAGLRTQVHSGPAAITELARLSEVDCVMAAICGAAGLDSTLAAARAGKRLLLANKESVVMAGALLMQAVQASGATLIPIDSEHNAIFQCLPAGARLGVTPAGVRRLLLTASGGPFLEWNAAAIARATPAQACAHPRWNMGRKISVDSATLMNKGLEFIEASVLFAVPAAAIEVVVHPQSIVHSLVEYQDGSMLAQLGSPDMRTPIAQALAWPARMASGVEFLDLVRAGRLDFRAPDRERFPCLALAEAAARSGGVASTWLNAADEVAVAAFLAGQLNFGDIAAVIETVMNRITSGTAAGLDEVRAADAEARARAQQAVRARAATYPVGAHA